MTSKVLLIGGGTGGHILPLKPLLDELNAQHIETELVVADQLLDRQIVADNFPTELRTYYLQTGKIRRYLSFRNIPDVFRIVQALFRARKILQKSQPTILFFKGGFVGLPFFLAAQYGFCFRGKIFLHESDTSSGFLGKWITKRADKVFRNFDNKKPYPLFYSGQKNAPPKKQERSPGPHLLIFGGSQGAQFINDLYCKCHDKIITKYRVTILTGKGKSLPLDHPKLEQYETLPADNLQDLLLRADIVVARAGANSLFEIIHAQKPSIIIPLPSVARNHQWNNAQYFSQKGLCKILKQNTSAAKHFPDLLEKTLQDNQLKKNLQEMALKPATKEIIHVMISKNG